MNNFALLEIKNLILEQNTMLQMVIPPIVPLSQICHLTGKSRQTVRDYLINNFEPEADFYKKNGRIIIRRNAAVAIVRRYNAKR